MPAGYCFIGFRPCIGVSVCPHNNWNTTYQNWSNLVQICVMVPLEVVRYWLDLTSTCYKRKLRITRKRGLYFDATLYGNISYFVSYVTWKWTCFTLIFNLDSYFIKFEFCCIKLMAACRVWLPKIHALIYICSCVTILSDATTSRRE